MGDLYDFYSWGKWPRKRYVYTPEAEIGYGREMAEDFWKRVRSASRRSKCFQIRGNHDDRPYLRLAERMPELTGIVDGHLDGFFEFTGVETVGESRDELVIGDTMFMHGFRSKLGDHARHNRMSTVVGHSHTGGCVFIRNGTETLYELNCGFVADPGSIPMSYSRQRQISTWTQGFGTIDQFGPRFIPLPNPE